MCKPNRKLLLLIVSALGLLLLASLGYAYQRRQFVRRANAIFDPQHRAFSGVFLPWPVGRPTLAGGFDPATQRRVRSAIHYDLGSISSNGMTLIIRDSDGTFLVHAN